METKTKNNKMKNNTIFFEIVVIYISIMWFFKIPQSTSEFETIVSGILKTCLALIGTKLYFLITEKLKIK